MSKVLELQRNGLILMTKGNEQIVLNGEIGDSGNILHFGTSGGTEIGVAKSNPNSGI